jgi:hypothetical protein
VPIRQRAAPAVFFVAFVIVAVMLVLSPGLVVVMAAIAWVLCAMPVLLTLRQAAKQRHRRHPD